MTLNFTLDLRFEPYEVAVIKKLLRASGGSDGYLDYLLLRLHRSRQTVETFRVLAEQVTGKSVLVDDTGVSVSWSVDGRTYLFPFSAEKQLLFGFMAVVGPGRWLGAKYTLPGFVELYHNDVVIDCGAFVGGFSEAALSCGAQVLAVEPSRTNRRYLQQNVINPRMQLAAVGLGREAATARFQESSTGVDSSFSGVIDEGRVINEYDVPIMTLPEVCRRFAVSPTFVKIEAEGLEKDIVDGIGDLRPLKIAIDGSPEGGSNDQPALQTRLKSLGYDVATDRNMIYGRLAEEARS